VSCENQLVVSTLATDRVQRVLAEIRSAGADEYEVAATRLSAREAELGAKFYGRERAEIVKALPLAITPEVGQILYALTIAARPILVVEFGGSLGFSTIHLASALRDLDAGALITTELIAEKAERLAAHVKAAGLDDLVDVRTGDARDTLSDVDHVIDMLFLDGSNDLYLPVLEVCEPRLAPRALVVADLSHDEPHHDRYRAHVSSETSSYITSEIALDAGVLVSTRR
jgi:predicted O-methyltransferase YrrM